MTTAHDKLTWKDGISAANEGLTPEFMTPEQLESPLFVAGLCTGVGEYWGRTRQALLDDDMANPIVVKSYLAGLAKEMGRCGEQPSITQQLDPDFMFNWHHGEEFAKTEA